MAKDMAGLEVEILQMLDWLRESKDNKEVADRVEFTRRYLSRKIMDLRENRDQPGVNMVIVRLERARGQVSEVGLSTVKPITL